MILEKNRARLIELLIRNVEEWLGDNGLQPLVEFEKTWLELGMARSVLDADPELQNPYWELPWVVADMVFFLRNLSMLDDDGGHYGYGGRCDG